MISMSADELLKLQEKIYSDINVQLHLLLTYLYQEQDLDEQYIRFFKTQKTASNFFDLLRSTMHTKIDEYWPSYDTTLKYLRDQTSSYLDERCPNYYYKALLLVELTKRFCIEKDYKISNNILDSIRSEIILHQGKAGQIQNIPPCVSLHTDFYTHLSKGFLLIDRMSNSLWYNDFYQFKN